MNQTIKPRSTYRRVCPRDLFNEAKLLKCYGLLCLKILDNQTPVPMTYEDEHLVRFNVELLEEGSLFISNLPIKIKGKRFTFKTTYNSKSNYPFFVQTDDYCEYEVFTDSGEFTDEFIEFAKSV
jgi:hypothetical protein